MIGLVIVAHGDLGAALIRSAEMIFERPEKVFSVSISNLSSQVEALREDLLKVIDQANEGDGVLVMTDLFGGTPSNLSISALGIRPIEIIAGTNLPMVIKALSLREQFPNMPLAEVSTLVEEAGKRQISIASRTLEDA